MDRKKVTEPECHDYAVEMTVSELPYRRYDDNGSVDERRDPDGFDACIVRGAIAGALYAWRAGYCDARAAADVAEFIASAIESEFKGPTAAVRHTDWRLDGYVGVFQPITNFANS